MKVFNTSTTAWFFTIRLHFKKQYNATGKPFTRRKLRVFKNSRGTYHQFPKHRAFGSQSTAQICGWCPGSGLYSPWPSIKCKKIHVTNTSLIQLVIWLHVFIFILASGISCLAPVLIGQSDFDLTFLQCLDTVSLSKVSLNKIPKIRQSWTEKLEIGNNK